MTLFVYLRRVRQQGRMWVGNPRVFQRVLSEGRRELLVATAC